MAGAYAGHKVGKPQRGHLATVGADTKRSGAADNDLRGVARHRPFPRVDLEEWTSGEVRSGVFDQRWVWDSMWVQRDSYADETVPWMGWHGV